MVSDVLPDEKSKPMSNDNNLQGSMTMSSISTFTSDTTSFPDSDEQGFRHEFEEFLAALQSGNQTAAESAFEVIKHGFQESSQRTSRKKKPNPQSGSRLKTH
jgi:hypothetical protein